MFNLLWIPGSAKNNEGYINLMAIRSGSYLFIKDVILINISNNYIKNTFYL